MKSLAIIFLLLLALLGLEKAAFGQNVFPTNGFVGIGTTTPLKSLDVRTGQNNFATIGNYLNYGEYSGLHFGYLEDNLFYRKSALVFQRFDDAARGKIHLLNNGSYSSASASLTDAKLTIDFNGFVGIGNMNPSSVLDVNGDIKGNNGMIITKNASSETDNLAISIPQLRRAVRFSYATLGETGSGSSTILGNNIISAGISDNAIVRLTQPDNGSFLKLNYYHGITFHTGIQSDLGQPVSENDNEKMRITQYGTVLIGKSTQSNTNHKLDVAGTVRANEVIVNTSGADFVFDDNYKLAKLDDLENFIKVHRHLPGISPAKVMQENGVGISELQTKLLEKVEELTLHVINLSKENKLQENKIREQGQRIQELESDRKSPTK